MATTISTSQTYDSAARVAGDTYTIDSGAIFTVDSDTRDGKNAPASRNGSWSSFTMTAASGGTVLLDGTKVKYIKYDGLIGSPNVPALGTIIAGVTSSAYGELMNISSAISAIPTAAGSAMPATGIIKFKSIIGTFQDNETIEIQSSTDLCLANGLQMAGWIEVAMDDAAAFTIGRAQKFQITGSWFVSETLTSGSAHQQIQFPNYGGTNFFIPGCWIQQPDLSATYTLVSNVVTVTYTAHGYFIGQTVGLDFTSGTATDGLYIITSVPTANTFTVALTASDTSGNVTASMYEYYPSCLTGTGTPWSNSVTTTDARCKFVQCLAGGILRIGGDGTNAIGQLPASGRKIMVSNVFLKSAATASRSTDSVPNGTLATRPDFTTTNAGQIDCDGAVGHWNMILSQAYSVKLHRFALFDQTQITECATAPDLNDGGNGNYTIASDVPSLVLTSNYAGGTIYNWKIGRSGTIASADYGLAATYCNNFTFINSIIGHRTLRTNAAAYSAYFSYCNDTIMTGCTIVGGSLYISTCNRFTATNLKWSDNYFTATSTTTPQPSLQALYSVDVKLDGFSWFENITGLNPSASLITCSFVTNLTIRNIGTRATPLNVGAGANDTTFIYTETGNCINVRIQRVYCSNVLTRFISAANNTKGLIVENCAGDYADTHTGLGLDQILKNFACASVPSSGASVYGSIFYHIFTSTTQGKLGINFNETTATYAAYITTYFTTSATGTSGYNSNGGLALVNSGDYVIYEFPFLIKGIDSFPNSAPTITTSTNMTIEYQINTGSGWSALKAFTGANLNGESVNPTTGFYFRIKCTANATAAANILTVVSCLTNSDTTAQEVTYPLDVVPITIEVLNALTKTPIQNARVYLKTDPGAEIIFNDLTDVNGLVTKSGDYVGQDVIGRVRKATGSPLYKTGDIVGTVTSSGLTVTVLLISDD